MDSDPAKLQPRRGSCNPTAAPATARATTAEKDQRDFLLHLEAYLARRDGIDKLLKIARYAAKIAIAAPFPGAGSDSPLLPRLKSFESSVGLSRKAFRLGKFVQDVNAIRASSGKEAAAPILTIVAYGGEGIYYFVEQLVWLMKTGLLSPRYSPQLQKISAWAEMVGYFGSVAIKLQELRKIRICIEATKDDGEIRKLTAKLLLKRLSILQDLADALMALADVRDGKGFLSTPLLLSSAGLLSALISTHKNWNSC